MQSVATPCGGGHLVADVEGLECWTCTLHGDPVSKGRPRFARRGAKVISYTPARTSMFEAEAAALMAVEWGNRAPISTACELTVVSVFQRPGRLRCKHKRPCECDPGQAPKLTRPDLDNCAKAVSAAIQRAGVVHDDACVAALHAIKVWAAEGESPRTEIRLCWGPAVEAMR